MQTNDVIYQKLIQVDFMPDRDYGIKTPLNQKIFGLNKVFSSVG